MYKQHTFTNILFLDSVRSNVNNEMSIKIIRDKETSKYLNKKVQTRHSNSDCKKE